MSSESSSDQPRYLTVFDVLFELIAVGLVCWGCSYLGSKIDPGLGRFIGGAFGLPLWVAFRYAQCRFAVRKPPPTRG